MADSWVRTGATPWLWAPRPADGTVLAGITVEAGWLHQPTERLGVLPLLGAALVRTLTRPTEAVDRAAAEPLSRVEFAAGQLDSTLVLVGTAMSVASALFRVEQLLADPPEIEVDDALRDRARTYSCPLGPWLPHLVARWPGHLPHLAGLGPLAMDSLDSAALTAFVRETVNPATRVYWTNEPEVVTLVEGEHPAGAAASAGESADRASAEASAGGASAGRAPLPPLPADAITTPHRIIQRDSELFSGALPTGPATDIALSLLAANLRRRLVEFEPLATQVALSRLDVGRGMLLACAVAAPVTGKEAAVGEAARQTVLDLAGDEVTAAQIEESRHANVLAQLAGSSAEPAVLHRLAQEHLRGGDHPTRQQLATGYENVTDDEVRQVLRRLRDSLLQAIPAGKAGEGELPLVGRAEPARATGRRFPDRVADNRWIRSDGERVAVVEGVPRRRNRSIQMVTKSSVALDEVVLRIDTGDQATTLADRQLSTVRLVWGAYRQAGRLRQLVDEGTRDAPLIRQAPDPDWPDKLATILRKRRRQQLVMAAIAAVLVSIIVGSAIAARVTDPVTGSGGTTLTVDVGTEVSLPNGATITADQPELVVNHSPQTPYAYVVRVRMCGGSAEGRPGRQYLQQYRNHFGFHNFALTVGEVAGTGFTGLRDRPGPLGATLDGGECGTGWLAYRVVRPDPAQPLRLRYTNLAKDRVTWRLPAAPPKSPLSRPCQTPGGSLGGLPTPAPCPS